MSRIAIAKTPERVGETVEIAGWVDVRRDHGKLIFIDLRDASGILQIVVSPGVKDLHKVANLLRPEWVIGVTGIVKERPTGMVNEKISTGTVELEVLELSVLAEATELPFEKDTHINLDTYLDHLPLTLRTDRARSIFKVQAVIINAFRTFFIEKGFIEIQVPKIIGDDAEGGANAFDVEYFGHTAHLAQSPQFYKQIMVGVFERVFTTGNVYRAEKHSTTRHLNEYTSLDIEMGFISDHTDIMTIERQLLASIMKMLHEQCAQEFQFLEAEIPQVPKNIPTLKLREAQKILQKEYNIDCVDAPDLEPQHERILCEYAKKHFDSDFIFITHFPLSKRPMYTFEDPNDIGYARGFDLLFRGVEITTGGQRIHMYTDLVASIKKKGLDPEKFSFYLQAFSYGMPPHGGFGLGLERLTAKLLNIENIKEATLFPRDMNRIDHQLSE